MNFVNTDLQKNNNKLERDVFITKLKINITREK